MRTLLTLLVCGLVCGTLRAQTPIPATDARNTDIPNTDYHFKPRTYKTLAEWQARRAHLRKQILSAAGLMPMPPKNPLNPQIYGRIENGRIENGRIENGRIENKAYSIEKVLLETMPGYYLGGNLYRPMKPAPAGGFPGIVSPHGHWPYGRLEHSENASVPARCINLAQQGYVVFCYDMVGYNDTIQTPHDFGTPAEQLWDFGSLSLQLWNAIRAVDFLQSLPEVNAARIGATGASGGGTQTFLLSAVDDRIQFSAPVNMISAIMQGGGICENAPNLRLDTFNVEIAAMMAPRPMIMVSATGDWTKNNLTEEFPAVRAIYELYDQAANVESMHQDAPHNYNQVAREAVYRFFGKHVLGESDASRFKERGIRVEKLQDMLALHNRSFPANALDYAGIFDQWVRTAQRGVREITDRSQLREMLELALGAEWPDRVVSETKGESIVFGRPDRGDRVGGFWLAGEGRKLLFVHPDGAEAARKSPEFAALVRTRRPIYAIDAFQTGAAIAPRNRQAPMFLTFNRSDDANRVQDILTVLRWLDAPDVELVGVGKAAVWCQFAAALSRRRVVLKADVSNFTETDREYVDGFFVPGIQHAGGLRVARLLTENRE
jgi:dienelactone hydrolase